LEAMGHDAQPSPRHAGNRHQLAGKTIHLQREGGTHEQQRARAGQESQEAEEFEKPLRSCEEAEDEQGAEKNKVPVDEDAGQIKRVGQHAAKEVQDTDDDKSASRRNRAQLVSTAKRDRHASRSAHVPQGRSTVRARG